YFQQLADYLKRIPESDRAKYLKEVQQKLGIVPGETRVNFYEQLLEGNGRGQLDHVKDLTGINHDLKPHGLRMDSGHLQSSASALEGDLLEQLKHISKDEAA